jgi:hypothetical protein
MTPLLPNPDHYLHGSGEELLKSTSIVNVFIAENFMNYTTLLSTTYALNVRAVEILQRMLYPRVDDVIRRKVVKTGETG